MPKRSKEEEKKLREQVEKVKPGFIPVRQTRSAPTGPASPVNSGTPDTAELRSKAQQFSGTDVDDATPSTEELKKKFLPNRGGDNPGGDAAPRTANAKKPTAQVKGNPRIVSVRPTRGADSDEGVAPKDVQIVMDDEGQIGESS